MEKERESRDNLSFNQLILVGGGFPYILQVKVPDSWFRNAKGSVSFIVT